MRPPRREFSGGERPVRSIFSTAFLVGTLVHLPAPAVASEDVGRVHEGRNRDRLRSVQSRPVLKAGRFSLSGTYARSVNDALVLKQGGGLTARYHLAEGFAFLMNGTFVTSQQTDYVHLVRYERRLVLEEPEMKSHMGLGFSYTPIYGKFSLFSDWILHNDVYIEGAFQLVDIAGAWQPSGLAGLGARIYLGQAVSFEAGLRSLMYATEYRGVRDIKNLMFLNTGVSLFLPLKNLARRRR